MTKSGTKASSLWKLLEQFPPYYVRLLAKRPGSGRGTDMAIEDAELAITSGLTLARVRQIALSETWQDVTISEIMAFTVACNFDPMSANDRKRVCQYNYICKKRNATPFHYLKASPRWESEFLPLIRIWKARLLSPGPNSASSPVPASA